MIMVASTRTVWDKAGSTSKCPKFHDAASRAFVERTEAMRSPTLATEKFPSPVALVAALLAITLALFSRPAISEELGRLFFSPGQRQELERRRTLNIQATVVTREDLVNATGVVTRSSGKSTIWLNGRPQDDVRKDQESSRITVELGDGQPPISLKVGETLEMGKGQSKNGLNGGSVSVRPRRP